MYGLCSLKSPNMQLRAPWANYAPQDATLHGIADRLQTIERRNFYQLCAEASHRGCYAHEYTMSVDVTRDSTTWQPPADDAE